MNSFKCQDCGGSGEVPLITRRLGDLRYAQTKPCPTCHGKEMELVVEEIDTINLTQGVVQVTYRPMTEQEVEEMFNEGELKSILAGCALVTVKGTVTLRPKESE